MTTSWPAAAHGLMSELASSPGRIALVAGRGTREPLAALAQALAEQVRSAGRELTSTGVAPTPAEASRALSEATLVDDAEILLAPELALDVLALLRDLTRRHPVVLNWPGTIRGGKATYSEPGRRDHYQRRLADAVILHPVDRRFPDQSPYRLERIP